jgi:SAM-dependent methyltransferase
LLANTIAIPICDEFRPTIVSYGVLNWRFSKMTFGGAVARLAKFHWVGPMLRAATRVYLQFGPPVLHIDEPKSGVIDKHANIIRGWFICRSSKEDTALQLARKSLTWNEVERSDAKQLFACARGFTAIADVEAIADEKANLELIVKGSVVASKPLRLVGGNAASFSAWSRKRAEKRSWLKAHVACPNCRGSTLDFRDTTIRCRSCGESFTDDGKVLNFLPEEFKREFNIADWNDISAHGYDEVAIDLIESVRHIGGKVLDCGSGLRSEVDETVICLEVDAFPNVDVLGVNQKLPFQNSVFDAVLSLNVLEHVTDPFACASELIRVLKPGGMLYCCIPFMQPEHGYPDHYFNATRSGLRQLFGGRLELLRHFVPRSGEPVWSLHWFLSWYVEELPASERAEFLNMRVEDLLAKRPSESLDKTWVTHLSENGKWRLASSTAAVFRKSASG